MKKLLTNLKNTWRYSDSQPTEITLGAAMMILAPIAVSMETHCSWYLNIFFIFAGIFQIRCVATNDIICRIRGAFITSSAYLICLLLYLTTIGLPTPSHWGWVLLTYSSFSTLSRLKTEQLRRNASK